MGSNTVEKETGGERKTKRETEVERKTEKGMEWVDEQ